MRAMKAFRASWALAHRTARLGLQFVNLILRLRGRHEHGGDEMAAKQSQTFLGHQELMEFLASPLFSRHVQ